MSCEQLLEWHAADKMSRYDIELDASESILLPGKLHRAALKFTPHPSSTGRSGGEPHWIILYNVENFDPRARFDGPAWKRGHTPYYVRAALRTLQTLGLMPCDALPPAPEPARAALPLPPVGPACPGCAATLHYEQGYVGGKGYCWRHVCPDECGYFDRWK